MAVRPHFDPKGDYEAARAFTFLGRRYEVGTAFPHPADDVPTRMVSQQYGSRAIRMVAAKAIPQLLVALDLQPGGIYLITAPWLAEPERVKGKKKAVARQGELLAQEPLSYGHVTVEGAGAVWTVTPAWGDDVETLSSETAARDRARTIRMAGPPAGWAPSQQ